ncbi:hypothetical protein [Streptomyces boncukensis]|uniref:Uncharacterized protein n=1 Tax=Streptomyces boncukensis TaxID=2711219 RepID=A0A6G4X6T2_9ACTN|nr:hypothetical protein [Streptomyces boncukensis]NGO72557.1 hypothetical protein [Streptomyces boncukensis]
MCGRCKDYQRTNALLGDLTRYVDRYVLRLDVDWEFARVIGYGLARSRRLVWDPTDYPASDFRPEG